MLPGLPTKGRHALYDKKERSKLATKNNNTLFKINGRVQNLAAPATYRVKGTLQVCMLRYRVIVSTYSASENPAACAASYSAPSL